MSGSIRTDWSSRQRQPAVAETKLRWSWTFSTPQHGPILPEELLPLDDEPLVLGAIDPLVLDSLPSLELDSLALLSELDELAELAESDELIDPTEPIELPLMLVAQGKLGVTVTLPGKSKHKNVRLPA